MNPITENELVYLQGERRLATANLMVIVFRVGAGIELLRGRGDRGGSPS